MRKTTRVLVIMALGVMLAPNAHAATTGIFVFTQVLGQLFGELTGPVAYMFAGLAIIAGLIRLFRGMGEDSLGKSVGILMVAAVVAGVSVFMGQLGITGATV